MAVTLPSHAFYNWPVAPGPRIASVSAMSFRTLFAVSAAVLAALPASAQTRTVELEAFENNTIRSEGPRTGNSNQNFFNIQGVADTEFSSFGIADFVPDPQPDIESVISAELALTQANAFFTSGGTFNIYLDTLATTLPEDLAFDTEGDGEGTDTALADGLLMLTPLATGVTFEEVESGHEDVFPLALDEASKAFILNGLNNGELISLILTPTDPNVAATYAGNGNEDFAGPTLRIVVEDPGAIPVNIPFELETAIEFTIESQTGKAYRIEYSETLEEGSFEPVEGYDMIEGTGETLSVFVPFESRNRSREFYEVVEFTP